VSPAGAPPLLLLSDAVGQLLAPDAAERFSPLTGAALLAVDVCAGDVVLDADETRRVREALTTLPAPTVAFAPEEPGAASKALLDRFDVIVEESAQLERLGAAVQHAPLAAGCLTGLLRHGEERSSEAGLIAESTAYSTLQGGPEFARWLASHPKRPMPDDEGLPLRVWRELDTLHLRLDRSHKHNAFSAAMRDALCEALELAIADTSIREVVLSGEGTSFSSGGDLDEFGSLPDPATAHAIRTTRSPARLLARCADRVRCELQGACVGAGVELPAFAARVSASEDAFFQLPELAMGLVPGAGGTVSLPRRIGRQRTAWLALSGQRLDAETALAWGLVDELRPPRRD
jgi:enoyl-CoA hydratase/carnithine racemase